MARTGNGSATGLNIEAVLRKAMAGDDVVFASSVTPAGRLSTGSAALDLALGGGVPLGRITHVPGLPGSGRTTLMYTMIAKAQLDGRRCVYVDADHRFNEVRAKALGVNTDSLVLVEPRTVERAFEAIETLALTGVFSLIVVDSVASMTPRAELNGDFGDAHSGLLDKQVEQGLRKLLAIIADHKIALVLTNQYRTDPGVMFGSGRYAPGELDNFAALTLEVRRETLLRRKVTQTAVDAPKASNDVEATIAAAVATAASDAPEVAATADESIPEPEPDTFGMRLQVKIVQNSDGPSYRKAHVHIVFAEGISREGDLVELGVALGVLTKVGARFYFGDTLLGVHEEGAAEFLRNNAEVALEIEAELLAARN